MRHPVMRNRKIELDAERRPGPAVANLSFFDGRIGIEHRLAIDLVDAGVKMPANVRQYGALQIFVFQVDGAPGVIRAAAVRLSRSVYG